MAKNPPPILPIGFHACPHRGLRQPLALIRPSSVFHGEINVLPIFQGEAEALAAFLEIRALNTAGAAGASRPAAA
jgi:hypothetical protein